MTTSQHPRMAALPAKQYPELTPDERHRARELGEPAEGQAVEPAHADAVGVARTASATLGEEHDRDPQLLGHLEQPILLAVVLCPGFPRAPCSRTTPPRPWRHDSTILRRTRRSRRRCRPRDRRPASRRSGRRPNVGVAERRSPAARTPRTCLRRRDHRRSRAPCGARATGVARRHRADVRRDRPHVGRPLHAGRRVRGRPGRPASSSVPLRSLRSDPLRRCEPTPGPITTVSPCSTVNESITPPTGAATSWCIFIDSTSASTSPARTRLRSPRTARRSFPGVRQTLRRCW
jgi:hypothetical protein